jgi:hypothetical protein
MAGLTVKGGFINLNPGVNSPTQNENFLNTYDCW